MAPRASGVASDGRTVAGRKARGERAGQREQQIVAVRLGFVVAKVLGPLPFDSRCLMRSLVLTAMLARRGIPSAVVIGVEPEPEFAAHAWVEADGVAVLPPGRYGRVVEV